MKIVVYERSPLKRVSEWTTALRSGKYIQGTRALKKVNEQTQNCCLGVLCEIMGLMEEADHPERLYHIAFFVHGGTRSASTIPNGLARELGVTDSIRLNGYVMYGNEKLYTLTQLNDSGATFEEIAEVIEAFFYEPE